jgi:hypothetical protein
MVRPPPRADASGQQRREMRKSSGWWFGRFLGHRKSIGIIHINWEYNGHIMGLERDFCS